MINTSQHSSFLRFKVTGHSNKKFVIKHVPLNARVSGNLNLKFHNLSPFCIFLIDFADFKSKRGHIVKRRREISQIIMFNPNL